MAKGSVLSQPNGMELIPSELFLIRDGPLFLGGREGGHRRIGMVRRSIKVLQMGFIYNFLTVL